MYVETEIKQYCPGDLVKGKIRFTPSKSGSISDIELSFIVEEKWNSPDDITKSGNIRQIVAKIEFDLKKYLTQQQDNLFYLEKKKYIFPFEYKLPDILNPSFEYPTYRAYLRYMIDANIISNKIFGKSYSYVFILAIPKRNLNMLSEGKNLALKTWGLFQKGSTDLKATLHSNNFRFKDSIEMTISVDNTKSKLDVRKFKIYFMQTIILRDKKLVNIIEKTTKLDKFIVKHLVKKYEKGELNYSINLSSINLFNPPYIGYIQPYNHSESYGINWIPSIDGTIINCEYSIKIVAYLESYVKNSQKPSITLPINIINGIPKNENIQSQDEKMCLEEEKDIKKAIEESKTEEELRKQNQNTCNNNYPICNNDNKNANNNTKNNGNNG